ncbi:hypothetical protein DYBT9275_02594 [Dyadobacter sp. CECT 9275]|uniref:Uncharacterized protein n=1 Tax=Dyadobacter helix TaxID=2822344 RepID=A0A916JFZ0_9BACT|nr:hypothetical protein [Dyadobacter sp. CECT 9275]CAG5001098.1 hypothetical protein DYBT9275_02594 [Dyadobacter sp. CECT 9275]
MEGQIKHSTSPATLHILKFTGIFLLTGLLLSLLALGAEFSYGNGDGIWFDLDIRRTAFRYVTFSAVVAVTLMLLFSKVWYVRSVTFGLLGTFILLFGIEKLCQLIIFLRTPAPTTQIQPPFERTDWKNSAMMDDTLGVKAKPNWSFAWAPVYRGLV